MPQSYTQLALTFDPCKRCIGCQQLLPLDAFHRDRHSRDGRVPRCKSCARVAYAANPEPARIRAREWARQNPERNREKARVWRQENPERKRAADKAWAEKNRERVRETSQRWARENPEKVLAYNQAYQKKNPDWVRSYHQEYRRKNIMARRLWYQNYIARKHSATVAPFTAEQLAAKVAYWGHRCWVCQGPYEALDHVKPLAKGGLHCLANLRPICTSCNSRKCDTWPFTV